MSSGIFSMSINSKGFQADMKRITKAEDRATQYAMRATGRQLAKTAKSIAPKYPGPMNAQTEVDQRALAESGALRTSIRNARQLKKVAEHTYELKVGPFGTKTSAKKVGKAGKGARFATKSAPHATGQLRGVVLYRREAESMYGFMGHASAMSTGRRSSAIYEEAYDKAFRKAMGR